MRFAINPLQWYQQPDGTLDFAHKPPLGTVLAEVAQAGFTAMHAEKWPELSLEQYAAAFADAGVKPAPGYFSFGPTAGEVDPAIVEAAHAEASRHQALGLDRIFLAVDGNAARWAHPTCAAESDVPLAARVDQIGAVAQAFLSGGITPCFHQHVGTLIESEEETRAVLDGVPELAFGPDVGHLAWAGIDVLAILRDYAERIGAMHIKDAHLDVVTATVAEGLDYRATTLRGLWDELGRGDLPIDDAIDIARSADPDLWAVIEVDYTQLPTPLESARACAEWITTWKDNHR